MKTNVYPCKPQFYYIKVGFKGVKIIKICFRDAVATNIYTRCKNLSPWKPYEGLVVP